MPRPAGHYNSLMRWSSRLAGIALAVAVAAAGGGCARDVDYQLNASYNILGIDLAAKTIRIAGDRSLNFAEGETLEISQSSRYNGKYTLVTMAVENGYTLFTVDEDFPVSTHDIVALDQDAHYFELAGDVTTTFTGVTSIEVIGSSQNDGVYTLDEALVEAENTRLTVLEEIPDPTADGFLQPAGYGLLMHGEADQLTPDPTKVRLRFVTEGNLSPSFWYYMVFNFTKAPATAGAVVPDEDRPIDDISSSDRARNWELYVVVHVDGGGGEQTLTLQRPRYPTVLPTGRGPVDVTSGYFNDGQTYQDGQLVDIAGNIVDLAVACELDNKVQLVLGVQPDPTERDPVYYLDAADIPAGSGTGLLAPIRLQAGEFTADQNTDLLILYAGNPDASTPVPGVLRVLAGDGAGGFSAYSTDAQLAGTPVDWVIDDFNGDGVADAAVLTTADTGNQVELFIREDVAEEGADTPLYEFTAGTPLPVGDTPVAMAADDLQDGDGPDLVVADAGGEIDSDSGDGLGKLRLFVNDGTGTFTAGQVLSVEGQITGVNTGVLHGNKPDIVASYFNITDGTRDEDDQGNPVGSVAAFLIEGDVTDIADTAPTITFAGDPRYLMVADTEGLQGSYPSVVVVDGQSGTGAGDTHQSMYILRTGRQQGELTWDTNLIEYLSGANEPSRLHLADFNSDGVPTDFVIADSADSEGGNRISLYYSLGRQRPDGATGTFYHETRSNYSNDDIYWTDDPPQPVTSQEWYLNHTVGPNYIELEVDPVLFYDLTLQEPSSFIVDFMTGTTGIQFDENPDQLGIIRERMTRSVVVPIEVNFSDYNQISPWANDEIDDPAANIIDWIVEVS